MLLAVMRTIENNNVARIISSVGTHTHTNSLSLSISISLSGKGFRALIPLVEYMEDLGKGVPTLPLQQFSFLSERTRDLASSFFDKTTSSMED